MVLFFGSKIVDEESQIDDDKIGSRVRSVKYSLESFHSSSVYPVVNRGSSSETPVREIWRKSKVKENCFVEYESYQESCKQSNTCREEKYFQILWNTSDKEIASVFCNKESDKKFEIVPTTVDERCKSESIYQSDNHEVSNIRTNKIIENIEFG